MLQSLPAVKDETQFEYSYDAWQRMIGNAIRLSKAAWPGLHSPLTPENVATLLTPSGRSASSPPPVGAGLARPAGLGPSPDSDRGNGAPPPGDPKNN